MSLNVFQTTFKDLMLDHPDALNAPPDVITRSLNTDDAQLSKRLSVYRNNIIGSLTDVVCTSFPIINQLVGKEFLEGMARSFILENPPMQGNLNTYGAGFDDFIESFEPAKSLPYLPDVAKFEIALNQAYYAPDDVPMTAHDLAQILPENLAETLLNLRSSAFLVESQYPLLKIRDFCLKSELAAENENQTLDLESGGIKLLIYRPQLETEILELSDDAFTFLSHCYECKPIGQSLEMTLASYPEFDFQSFLATFLNLGVFIFYHEATK